MSRIGRQPIPVPAGVTVAIEPERSASTGPRANSPSASTRDIEVTQDGEQLLVTRPTDRGEHRALHGLTRSLVANMVEGVTAGYEKRLEIQGVGYRAQLKGKNLELAVGYSHPVPIAAPDGIEFEVPQPTRVVVKGISKQLVGETAAIIRKQRPPEPYKGKGIRYEGEYVAAQGRQARMTVAHARRTAASNAAAACARRSRAPRSAPRISVFRSNRGISAQLVDDVDRPHAGGRATGTSPSCARWPKPERTKRAGELLAERAKAAGVSEAVFDRGGYRYHGHVRAFAEAIREAGITV